MTETGEDLRSNNEGPTYEHETFSISYRKVVVSSKKSSGSLLGFHPLIKTHP